MIALIDACVLFSPVQREFLLLLQDAGLMQLRWSPRLIEEWQRAAMRLGVPADLLAQEIALVTARAPLAMTATQDDRHFGLPDRNDDHVLAAALAAKAEVIVTMNMRDFPARVLAGFGLRAQTPDHLARALPADLTLPVLMALRRKAPIARQPADAFRQSLKRHRLPRMAKLWRENVTETDGSDAF